MTLPRPSAVTFVTTTTPTTTPNTTPARTRGWPLRTGPAAAVLALLAACGGGGGADPSAALAEQTAASAFAAAPRAERVRLLATTTPATTPAANDSRRQALATPSISNEQLFTWAQQTYPALFGTAAPQTLAITYQGKAFDVRFYAATGAYLGVTNGEVFGLGAFTGGALQSFGAVAGYGDLVCAKLACGSTGGGTPGGSGALNDCTDPNGLAAGNRVNVVYTYSGIITGEQTVETVVNGSASFEGQSATQTTSTTRGSNTVQGFTVPLTTVVKAYLQPADNGLTRTLGSVVDATTGGISIGGFTSPDTTISTKAVFEPAELNSEFTLAVGQSVTKTTTVRSTVLSSSMGVPAPGTVTTAGGSTTHTFEARESITVPAGTYSTCRYRVAGSTGDVTTSWFIVGRGIMAKSEARTSAGTQTIQLKSGTLNGARL